MQNSSCGELKEKGFSARYPSSVPLAFKWKRSCLFRAAVTLRGCASAVSLNHIRGLCAAHQSSDSRTSLNTVMLVLQKKARV